MEELTFNELILFNGGSQETYEAGQKAGEKVRDFIDDCGALITIISVVLFILK